MPRIDWPKSSLNERKALAKIVIELMRELDITLNDVVSAATGKKVSFAASFIDNFRAGRSKKSTYEKVEEWLRRNYPDHADQFDIAAVTVFIPSASNTGITHFRQFSHNWANGSCSICRSANRLLGSEYRSGFSFLPKRQRDIFSGY